MIQMENRNQYQFQNTIAFKSNKYIINTLTLNLILILISSLNINFYVIRSWASTEISVRGAIPKKICINMQQIARVFKIISVMYTVYSGSKHPHPHPPSNPVFPPRPLRKSWHLIKHLL